MKTGAYFHLQSKFKHHKVELSSHSRDRFPFSTNHISRFGGMADVAVALATLPTAKPPFLPMRSITQTDTA